MRAIKRKTTDEITELEARNFLKINPRTRRFVRPGIMISCTGRLMPEDAPDPDDGTGGEFHTASEFNSGGYSRERASFISPEGMHSGHCRNIIIDSAVAADTWRMQWQHPEHTRDHKTVCVTMNWSKTALVRGIPAGWHNRPRFSAPAVVNHTVMVIRLNRLRIMDTFNWHCSPFGDEHNRTIFEAFPAARWLTVYTPDIFSTREDIRFTSELFEMLYYDPVYASRYTFEWCGGTPWIQFAPLPDPVKQEASLALAALWLPMALVKMVASYLLGRPTDFHSPVGKPFGDSASKSQPRTMINGRMMVQVGTLTDGEPLWAPDRHWIPPLA